jgi:phosphoglycolate phosphatase
MADSVKYEAVIFDLDGTLLDTLEDLADSMNAVLQQLNFPTHPTEKYRYFVGDGMRQLARRVLPVDSIDESMVDTTVKLMSAEYNKRWNVKTKPYSGLAELLDHLAAIGVKMAVLSNKPDAFTKIMVPALLSRWSFHPILGARNGVPIKPDPQSALEIAGIWGINPDKILYVGDTGTDMFTANAAGMKAVGAAWGFRTVEELLTTGARSIVHHPMDIVPLLES